MGVIIYRWCAEGEKASSKSQMREVEALKAQVARIPELVQEQVEQQLGTKLNAMVPTLINGLTTWIAGGQQGPPPVPSFTASNSHSTQAPPVWQGPPAYFWQPPPYVDLTANDDE